MFRIPRSVRPKRNRPRVQIQRHMLDTTTQLMNGTTTEDDISTRYTSNNNNVLSKVPSSINKELCC
jgi:hypothetical protein